MPREFRCIFDTNIYGLIIEKKILFSELKKVLDKKKLIIYGECYKKGVKKYTFTHENRTRKIEIKTAGYI